MKAPGNESQTKDMLFFKPLLLASIFEIIVPVPVVLVEKLNEVKIKSEIPNLSNAILTCMMYETNNKSKYTRIYEGKHSTVNATCYN